MRQELQYKTLDPALAPIERNGIRLAICSAKSLKQLIKNKKLKLKKNFSAKGVPQGISISNTLSNIYMLDFDLALKKFTQQKQGIYYRYCDDVICILPVDNQMNAKNMEQSIRNFVLSQAKQNHLVVNKDKTASYLFMPENKISATCQTEQNTADQLRCYPFDSTANCQEDAQPPIYTYLQWLGFEFTGTQVTLRSSTIARFQAKRKKRIYNSIKSQLAHKNPDQVSAKKLRKKCTHFGKLNFVTYAYEAHKALKFSGIKKQLRKHNKEFEQRFYSQFEKAKPDKDSIKLSDKIKLMRLK